MQAIANLTPAQLAARNSVTVPARPPRGTVVLTKIGNAFYESGLTDEAKTFYLRAIQISPNGASRARQSLAKLALAGDNPSLGERYARESLLMGRFQAKTVAAWQLYLDARARQNFIPILEPDVLAAFQANTKGRIAGASLLSIIRVLRAHGDPQWKALATDSVSAGATDGIIKTELEKILQADLKLTPTNEVRSIAARALRLYRASDTTAQELIAHGKTYVRFSLLDGKVPNLNPLIQIATRRFVPALGFALRHTAALGAMIAVKHDLARDWLQSLIRDTSAAANTEAWGKACWALARMEAVLGKNSEAAFWYMEVASRLDTPPRFKIQAMLRGLAHLTQSGDKSTNLDQLIRKISVVLAAVSDFRVLLDAARQLALSGPDFATIRDQTTMRATTLADRAIANAATPKMALAELEYLSRKLFWDLGGELAVLNRWELLAEKTKREFAAVGGSCWFELLSLVFLCMTKVGRNDEAIVLAKTIVTSDQSTSEGYVIMGSVYADWLVQKNSLAEAYEMFSWIVKEAPAHRRAASAHYWLALKQYRTKKIPDAKQTALRVHACYALKPALLGEWETYAKSALILCQLDTQSANENYPGLFTLQFLDLQKAILLRELQQITE